MYQCVLPALASDTALEIALEEMALFLFMISSNSASLRGARDGSISLQRLHMQTKYILQQFMYECKCCFFFFASSVVLSPLFILTGLRGHSPAHMGVDVHMGHLVQGALGCH